MGRVIMMTILVWTGVETTLVDKVRIKEFVTEYIHEQRNKNERTIVEFHGRMPAIVAHSVDYSIRIATEMAPVMRGYVSIPVEIVSGKRVDARAVISVYCRTFDTVAVTAHQLQKHATFNPGDVVLKDIETTTLEDDVLRSMTDLSGMRTKRIVAANSVLRLALMERIPVLNHDDHVTITVRSKNAIVTANGIAREDGSIGDFILVQRAGSHQRLNAQIVDAHRVEIRIEDVNRLQKFN
jgi:flagella basal body P-ring formation protein FlgA